MAGAAVQYRDFKEIRPFWALADSVTVVEAAALLAGFDPCSLDSSLEYFKDRETGLTCSVGITDFDSAFNVLIGSISHGKLNSKTVYLAEPRFIAGIDRLHERVYWGSEDVSEISGTDGEKYVIANTPDWRRTTISMEDLDQWLGRRGLTLDLFSVGAKKNLPPATDESHRLRQLEAENADLLDVIESLNQALQDAVTALKQAQQETAPPPQQATAAPQDESEDPLHPKRETTYLNAIGALVELIQSPQPGRDSEAAVIRELVANYSDRPGISRRTLEPLFTKARTRLQST